MSPHAIELICGTAAEFQGSADLVLTNPYGPLAPQLVGKPAIIANFTNRKAKCEEWIGAPLVELSAWSVGLRNRVWIAGLAFQPIDLTDLVEDELEPGRGWFPLELPMRLLQAYAEPGMTVIDPFMGRGTVGKACQMLGMNFIGIDINPERVALAREYLGLAD